MGILKNLPEVPGMPRDEVQKILVQFNDTIVDYPRDACLHNLFESQVERTPDAVALEFEGLQLTYAELNKKSNQLAHHLQHFGVGPEVAVGVYMERSIEMVIALYGILKAGGAYVPLDPDYPSERIVFMLEDSEPPVILTQNHLQSKIPVMDSKILCLDTDWENIAEEESGNLSSGVAPANIAYIIFTSGTTGRPKGVMNTHQGICNRLLWMQDQYQLTQEDSVIQKTPFSFDVSVWEFFWPLLFGAKLVVAKPGGHKDSHYLVNQIIDKSITTMHFVPSMLQIFLDDRNADKCTSLKRVICSGEALPLDLQERFFAKLNAELHNLYGPTEAAVDVTYWPCKQGSSLGFVPIGRPVANTQIYILDEQMLPVPVGEEGELHIGGIQVARGYINRPQLTEEKFIPDPFTDEPGGRLYKTGDLAAYLPSGDIKFLGRIDHQVKIGGNRIELGEIETVLGMHEGIKQAVVLAREDKPGEKRLVAYVVPSKNQELNLQELRGYLDKILPDYMIPSVFVPMEKMPLSPNGKVERRELPKPSNLRPALAQTFISPSDELERYLASLWCEIINLDRVGVKDRFFELGGTSLQAARFINRLQEDLDVNIYVTSIFESPTVASYAEFLRRDYVQALRQKFGQDIFDESVLSSSIGEASRRSKITEETLSRMAELIVPLPKNGGNDKGKNAPAIFILAPPRSGTTLLRVMLAGHPDLFAGSELQLLGFNTLKERSHAYSGKYKLWLEGTIRAIMEIKHCSSDEAIELMEMYEEKGYSTKEFYAVLQEWIGERTLVDKSPSYALDMNTLIKAEKDFEQAKYIHLTRHPYAMVRSFEKYHMDQVLYLKEQPFSAQELGELVWIISHKNVLEFLKTVPTERQFHMHFEELVTEPKKIMENFCQAFDLPFETELLKPYENLNQKMTDGIYKESKPMGDTHFFEHSDIDPGVASEWQGVMDDNFLSDLTWDLARKLGYPDPFIEDTQSATPHGEEGTGEMSRRKRLEDMRRRRLNKRLKN
jgi:amino acid adenylation domain-containing protein